MAIKMIDDSILQDIAESIQAKDGLGKMTPGQMPGRIDDLNGGGDVPNPDDPLLLVDWDGTLLYSYTYEDAQQISEFPDAPTHEGLTFQSWNWTEVVAKTWLQNHRDAQLKVGAVYTPTDGQDHNYWRSPRLSGADQIYMQHRASEVGDYAFSYFHNLETVSLPNDLIRIGNFAFTTCLSLKSIVLPNGLTGINNNAFYSCQSIITIVLPPSLTSVGSNTFQYCYSLENIIIPDNVQSLGGYAFANCSSFKSAVLSRSLIAIYGSAFRGCTSLAFIHLPNTLQNIGGNAFQECYSLSQIDIPSATTNIGNYAFQSCTSLVDVIIRGTPALGGSNVFSSNPSNQRIYVHRSDLSWFETATNWSAIYGNGKIVAAADYIEYLQSIGIDTSDFEGE